MDIRFEPIKLKKLKLTKTLNVGSEGSIVMRQP
jgi:hypothetical protein